MGVPCRYAMGSGVIWDVWGALVEPIAARLPYMVTVGNHEYDHVGKRTEWSGAPPGGWHPAWGNMGDDSRGECGVPTAARFNGTGSASDRVVGHNGVFWYVRHVHRPCLYMVVRMHSDMGVCLLRYSFEEGLVHVTVLSSEHDWTRGSQQYTWLEADLASVNRTTTPWLVLATHRMMYTTQTLEDADYKVWLGTPDP